MEPDYTNRLRLLKRCLDAKFWIGNIRSRLLEMDGKTEQEKEDMALIILADVEAAIASQQAESRKTESSSS